MFFAIVVFVKTLQSLMALFDGASIAVSAHGIPLETFSPAGSQAFVTMYALFSFARLVLLSISALVLWRYRSAIPFMFAVLVLDHLGRLLILRYLPFPSADATIVAIVNIVLLALLVVGFGLSLRRGGPPDRSPN
jgi:hypothetical protein